MIRHKPHHKGFKQKTYQEKIQQWKPKDRTTTLKQHKRLNPRGKSNRSKERHAWQMEMLRTYAHIDWCEWPGCHDTFGLAHAHRVKKTKITAREEWLMVARLCEHHHNWIEYGDKKHKGSHRRMCRLATVIIHKRAENCEKVHFSVDPLKKVS